MRQDIFSTIEVTPLNLATRFKYQGAGNSANTAVSNRTAWVLGKNKLVVVTRIVVDGNQKIARVESCLRSREQSINALFAAKRIDLLLQCVQFSGFETACCSSSSQRITRFLEAIFAECRSSYIDVRTILQLRKLGGKEWKSGILRINGRYSLQGSIGLIEP